MCATSYHVPVPLLGKQCPKSDKEKFQIDYKDEAIRGVLAVDAGNVTWPAPQKPPPPPPAEAEAGEVSCVCCEHI